MVNMGVPSKPAVDIDAFREAIREEYETVACEPQKGTWWAPLYEDAPQKSSAENFGTLGVDFHARK